MTRKENRRGKDSKRSNPLAELEDETLQRLADLLALPLAKTFALKGSIRVAEDWLTGQERKIDSLPRKLKRGNCWLPTLPLPLLCKYHRQLDPELIRWIFCMLKKECTKHVEHRRRSINGFRKHFPNEYTPRIGTFHNGMKQISSLYLKLKNRMHHCLACIVAVFGAQAQILVDLRANMLARMKHDPPRLLRLVDAWILRFSEGNADGILFRESNDIYEDLKSAKVAMSTWGLEQLVGKNNQGWGTEEKLPNPRQYGRGRGEDDGGELGRGRAGGPGYQGNCWEGDQDPFLGGSGRGLDSEGDVSDSSESVEGDGNGPSDSSESVEGDGTGPSDGNESDEDGNDNNPFEDPAPFIPAREYWSQQPGNPTHSGTPSMRGSTASRAPTQRSSHLTPSESNHTIRSQGSGHTARSGRSGHTVQPATNSARLPESSGTTSPSITRQPSTSRSQPWGKNDSFPPPCALSSIYPSAARSSAATRSKHRGDNNCDSFPPPCASSIYSSAGPESALSGYSSSRRPAASTVSRLSLPTPDDYRVSQEQLADRFTSSNSLDAGTGRNNNVRHPGEQGNGMEYDGDTVMSWRRERQSRLPSRA